MKRYWLRLGSIQKKIVICLVAVLSIEIILWGSILLGRSLQYVFWFYGKSLLKQGQVVEEIPYASLINLYAARYNVDPALVAAVIRCESDFNPRALSKAGAVGLMQICLPTWQDLKKGEPEWQAIRGFDADMHALYQPQVNIAAGTKYLQMMLEHYQGDAVKAVAAYNAGPSNVDRYRGIPPITETRRYVHHVTTVWMDYRGVSNRIAGCYHWGRRIETLGLHIQSYLYIAYAGGLMAYLFIRCAGKRKRRW